MKIYLCCPVRGIEPDYQEAIEFEVAQLEKAGHDVYYPARDTNQTDTSGYNICQASLNAIKAADIVYVIWNKQSQGVLFDLGLAFALGKPVKPVIGMFPASTPGKSFASMVHAWEDMSTPSPAEG